MRLRAMTVCLALVLTDACDDSAIDLVTSPSPESSRSISLSADSAVTALDSSVVNTNPHFRCAMGLRVRGSSTITGETAVWTGGHYQLVGSASSGPQVPVTVNELVGWFGTDRVGPGEVVATTRAFESGHRFTTVIVSITVELFIPGDPSRRTQTLSTSFACG